MNGSNSTLLILIVLAIGLVGAFWFFRDDILPSADVPVVESPEYVAPEAPASRGPIHPLEPLSPQPYDGELIPLPPLDDSDGYFLLALIDIFGRDVGPVLANEALIDKFVATVDNLPRSQVAEKIRPVGRLSGAFAVDVTDDDGGFYLSPDNYRRYDLLVDLATRADLDLINATYRRFYPLLQESYVRLGYPDAYFNDRVVEVIDHLLATPVVDEPIRLVRPHVLYEFADAELEALSSGQKLLLRIGGEHAANIKRVLRSLRGLVAQSPG